MFKNAKKLFAQVFMVLLAASFLTWGANSYFVNTPKSIAIEVNGEKVSVSELQTEYNFRLKEAEKQFGGKLSQEFLNAMQLGNTTVNGLITSKLALDEAHSLGFRASPVGLRAQIVNNPAFQDENGNFNKEVYRASVSNYGFSTPGYEKVLKEETVKQNLYGIFNTNINQDDYLVKLFKHINADMTIRSLMVNEEHIGEIPAITPAEVKSYYDSNSHRFTADETRNFTTLVVRADKLKDRVSVTEAEAKEVYDNNPEAFASEEERQARHILVSSEDEAMDIINQLDQGADFATLAKEKSTDTFTKNKGGDLGFFIYADMVEAFSDTAFNLEVDAISEPVKSPFGYHVIQVTAIQAEKPQTFNEVKESIIADLKFERSEDIYYDVLDQVEDKIAAGEKLETIASELNLTSNKYTEVKRINSNVAFATDVLPVVFDMNEGQVSDPILVEGQDTVTVFAELNKLNAERTLSIDEAREQIISEIKDAKKQKMVADKAQELLIERQNKDNLSKVAAAHNMSANLFETAGIKRNATGAPAWLKQMHINLLFAIKEGQALSSLVSTPDGMALVELVKIEDKTPDETELNIFKSQMSNTWQDDLFAQYMLYKRNQASITINESSIKAALGSAYVSQ